MKKDSDYFFIVKKRKEIIRSGPLIKDRKNYRVFKKKHKSTFEKKGRIFSREKIDFNIKKFIRVWKEKNKKIIREMGIREIKIKE